jgi:hypothetical protein
MDKRGIALPELSLSKTILTIGQRPIETDGEHLGRSSKGLNSIGGVIEREDLEKKKWGLGKRKYRSR